MLCSGGSPMLGAGGTFRQAVSQAVSVRSMAGAPEGAAAGPWLQMAMVVGIAAAFGAGLCTAYWLEVSGGAGPGRHPCRRRALPAAMAPRCVQRAAQPCGPLLQARRRVAFAAARSVQLSAALLGPWEPLSFIVPALAGAVQVRRHGMQCTMPRAAAAAAAAAAAHAGSTTRCVCCVCRCGRCGREGATSGPQGGASDAAQPPRGHVRPSASARGHLAPPGWQAPWRVGGADY